MTLTPEKRLGLVPLGALAAVALVGCGGSSNSSASGASSPDAAVKTYLTGVGSGNGAQACSVLSDTLQKRALSTAKSQGIKASSCSQLFSMVKAHLTAAQDKLFMTAKVSKVQSSGNHATATVAGAGSTPQLTKTGGKWLITGGIGF
ncbi:MAG TPA: hypothetical protein VE992_06095 [Solirubrobacteraceae bacterium]|nr:hypothetical protein [Solirubrobacteraceae bacterium]